MTSTPTAASTVNISSVKKPGVDAPALKELLTDEIEGIYWAEQQLAKALPKMQQAATSNELAEALGNHLEETKAHITRLEKVFALLGESVQARKSNAMEGLTREGENLLQDTEAGSSTRDVGIIISCRKVEHYKIAAYSSLTQLAAILGLDDIAVLLGQALDEEKTAGYLPRELCNPATPKNAGDTD